MQFYTSIGLAVQISLHSSYMYVIGRTIACFYATNYSSTHSCTQRSNSLWEHECSKCYYNTNL